MHRSAAMLLALMLTMAASSCGDDAAPDTTAATTTATTITTTATTSATSTTAPSTTIGAADPDGIPNGPYTGEVHLEGNPATPIYEVLASNVSLYVTDDEIRAEIDLTTRVSIRVSGGEPVCTATVGRRYYGRASPASPLTIVMELRGQYIITLDGPQCGVVDGMYEKSAEQTLAIEFAEDRPHPMTGSFADGRFAAIILEVLAVTAAVGQ